MSKDLTKVLDSRHVKVLAAKKEELKDAIVFICLDEDKYGHCDIAQLRKIADTIDNIEPSAFYFIGLNGLTINIFDRNDYKNKDLVVTISPTADQDASAIEDDFKKAFSVAKSINFVHSNVNKIEII